METLYSFWDDLGGAGGSEHESGHFSVRRSFLPTVLEGFTKLCIKPPLVKISSATLFLHEAVFLQAWNIMFQKTGVLQSLTDERE